MKIFLILFLRNFFFLILVYFNYIAYKGYLTTLQIFNPLSILVLFTDVVALGSWILLPLKDFIKRAFSNEFIILSYLIIPINIASIYVAINSGGTGLLLLVISFCLDLYVLLQLIVKVIEHTVSELEFDNNNMIAKFFISLFFLNLPFFLMWKYSILSPDKIKYILISINTVSVHVLLKVLVTIIDSRKDKEEKGDIIWFINKQFQETKLPNFKFILALLFCNSLFFIFKIIKWNNLAEEWVILIPINICLIPCLLPIQKGNSSSSQDNIENGKFGDSEQVNKNYEIKQELSNVASDDRGNIESGSGEKLYEDGGNTESASEQVPISKTAKSSELQNNRRSEIDDKSAEKKGDVKKIEYNNSD